MNAHQMERAAYIAAHRLLEADLSAPELACPGARRSALVDNIAKVIKSVYEAHSDRFDATTDWWPDTDLTRPDMTRVERMDASGARTVIALLKS
ncbi:MAG: hypothetical protein ACRD4P_06570 [Bryobacteraceae bacterium]